MARNTQTQTPTIAIMTKFLYELFARFGVVDTLVSDNRGARGVMVIVVGIGHDDTSSNPGRD